MMGLAVFGALALVLTVASFTFPKPPTCVTTHAIPNSWISKPDPTHNGKTIGIRAHELLDSFPTWKVGDPPKRAAIEKWLGVMCVFTVETHPGDSGIATPHKGVTVTECNP